MFPVNNLVLETGIYGSLWLSKSGKPNLGSPKSRITLSATVQLKGRDTPNTLSRLAGLLLPFFCRKSRENAAQKTHVPMCTCVCINWLCMCPPFFAFTVSCLISLLPFRKYFIFKYCYCCLDQGCIRNIWSGNLATKQKSSAQLCKCTKQRKHNESQVIQGHTR